jgi:hypothetical protein
LSKTRFQAHIQTKAIPLPRQTLAQPEVESFSNPKLRLARINDHELDLVNHSDQLNKKRKRATQQPERWRNASFPRRSLGHGNTKF